MADQEPVDWDEVRKDLEAVVVNGSQSIERYLHEAAYHGYVKHVIGLAVDAISLAHGLDEQEVDELLTASRDQVDRHTFQSIIDGF